MIAPVFLLPYPSDILSTKLSEKYILLILSNYGWPNNCWLKDYCELVDTTGRIIREDKVGVIDSAQSPILSRLGLSEEQWLTLTTEFEQHFCYAAGAEQMMQEFKTHTHRKRIGGMRQAKRLLS